MPLDITYNQERKGIELYFPGKPDQDVINRVKAMGFKYSRRQRMWYAKETPERKQFSEKLKDALENKTDSPEIHYQPSYLPTKENLESKNFSYVNISAKNDKGELIWDSYVLFEPSRPTAEGIASVFAKNKYGDKLNSVNVYPRNYITKARVLFEKGEIIQPVNSNPDEPEIVQQAKELPKEEAEPVKEIEPPVPEQEKITEKAVDEQTDTDQKEPEIPEAQPETTPSHPILTGLQPAYWSKEDEEYPVNKVTVEEIAYNQARLRTALLDKLAALPLETQYAIAEQLALKFKARRPLADYESGLQSLGKDSDKKKAASIRSFVDDIFLNNAVYQQPHDSAVFAHMINLLIDSSDVLVDHPKEKKTASKGKQSQHDLNKSVEEFIEQKDKEDGNYTAEDKAFISRYTGSGGLIKQGAKGKGVLYEYYTPDEIVKRMWALANKYGYNGGDILEPACGTGNFLKYAPANAEIWGMEINSTSRRIAQILYPQAIIFEKPFETFFFKGNVHLKDDFGDVHFSLVIGNPPYGEFSGKYAGMGEKKWTGATEYDQYFITRGLDLLKSEGLLVFIIPSAFLSNNSKYNKIKEKIAAKADLIDAYRLPTGIFSTTDIGTDIVVFRKKKIIKPAA
ncbi:MAG: N-6 DNA methylase [Flavobacteriales bacterium]|nr:N-6 DNA methylase [Flavobacteriales bacterium]